MSVPFQVKALHEYKSEYEDDLQFAAGQVITVTEIEDDDWYSGTYGTQSGLFPRNFVEIIKPSSSTAAIHEPVPVFDPVETPLQKAPAENSESLELAKESPIELEIDELIRKNSTALPEPLDEEDSVFEGNIKHVEESEVESLVVVSKKEDVVPPVPDVPATPVTPAKLKSVPIPRVPIPGSLPLQRDDPYAIKKQFIGVGTSSYVPQVKPRDNSSVSHGFNDVSENHEVVRETDAVPQAESNEPKMSLKERIAMLQKRQREEAEREAAALKKKEERKIKADEEKKSKASEPAVLAGSVTRAEPELGDLSPRIDVDDLNPSLPSLPPQKSGASSLLDPSAVHHGDKLGERAHVSKDEEEDLGADEEKDNEDNKISSGEDAEDAEEEEEEDDEDLRRKRLVERMAKISGGRNMFGMMGMPSPFGNTPAPTPKPKKQTREPAPASAPVPVSAPEIPSEEHQQIITPVEKASRVGVPIPGFVPPVELDKKQESKGIPPPRSDTLTSAEEEDEGTESVTENGSDDATVEPEETISKEKTEKTIPKDLVQKKDSVLPPPVRSPSDKPVEPLSHSMNIVDEHVQEPLFAGYEADADILDRGVLSEKDHGVAHIRPESSKITKGAGAAIPPSPKVAPPPPVDTNSIPAVPDATSKRVVPPTPLAPSAPPPPPARSFESDIHPPVPSEDAPLSPAFKGLLAEHFPSQAPPPVPTQGVPSLDEVSSRDGPQISKAHPPPPPPPFEVTDEYASSLNKRPPPPVPSDPPLPPSPQVKHANFVGDEDDDTSEDEIRVVDSQSNFQAKKSQTFSHPEPPRTPELAPSFPIRKSATGSLKRDSIESSRKSGELRRSGSFKDGRTGDQEQATLYVNAIEAELADLAQTSGWWIKSDVPDSLVSKLGVDLEYEVDENRLRKRDGREVIYKDYYILFHDLSQLVVEIQYQSDDPRDTVSIGSFKLKGSPKIRKDILHGYSSSIGQVVADFAGKSIGSKLGAGLVEEAFHQLKSNNANVLKPIGEKGFGAVVYKNFNHNITRIDDIRPGDILCMRSAKFHNHKGLAGIGSKSVSVGDGDEIYTAVILEYDPKKDKVKVAESGKGGVVKKESYKFGEMKAGRIKIYRVVSRESVGW